MSDIAVALMNGTPFLSGACLRLFRETHNGKEM
jgi:hypothetical protein